MFVNTRALLWKFILPFRNYNFVDVKGISSSVITPRSLWIANYFLKAPEKSASEFIKTPSATVPSTKKVALHINNRLRNCIIMLKHKPIVNALLRQRTPRQSVERMVSLQQDRSPTLQRTIPQAVGPHTSHNQRNFFSRFYSDSPEDTDQLKPNSRKYAFYDLDGEPPA